MDVLVQLGLGDRDSRFHGPEDAENPLLVVLGHLPVAGPLHDHGGEVLGVNEPLLGEGRVRL